MLPILELKDLNLSLEPTQGKQVKSETHFTASSKGQNYLIIQYDTFKDSDEFDYMMSKQLHPNVLKCYGRQANTVVCELLPRLPEYI
jgi:hypothetical protein